MLEGVLDGEVGARPDERFVALADRELHRAYRLAGLILGNQHEAEDATQDALLRAWTSFASLRQPDGFQAWFDRILVNVCRDRMRRRRIVRFVPLDGTHDQRPTGDPFHDLLAGDEVLRAMDGLDADLRAIVVLRYWADLTVDDIAGRVGIRAGTVKSRLHRAMALMRQQMTDHAKSEEPR